VVDYRIDGESLYVRCIPLIFPVDNEPAECILESWLRLEGNTVHVRNRLTNHRSDTTQYPAREAELPAVYTRPSLCRLVSYTGDKPYTGAPVTRFTNIWRGSLVKGTSPWSDFSATENWAALVRDDGWGLGVWHRDQYDFVGGFYDPAGGEGVPADLSAGYIAPMGKDILDHNTQYEYNYVLILDLIEDIRRYVYENADREALPDYRFERDRQHWYYENAHDTGWPIQGELHVYPEGNDSRMIGPTTFWYAGDAPTLIIEAAHEASDTRARVFWKCFGDGAFWEEKSLAFQINPDGEYHTYQIDLRGSPHCRGAIAGLGFRPIEEALKGEFVKVKRISLARENE